MRTLPSLSRRFLAAVAVPILGGAAAAQLELQPRLGEPIHGLSGAQRSDFEASKIVFNTPLTALEGLGPAFNDVSCGNCHASPDVGGSSVRTVTRFGRAAQGGNPFDPLENLGGSLLQEQAISANCEEHVPPRADVIAERLTPITFGAGLLELVEDGDILNLALNQPPGLNGVPSPVPLLEDPLAPDRFAKFGWKGVVATVATFTLDASNGELGLTNFALPQDPAPNGDQAVLMMCDTNLNDPEDVRLSDGLTRAEHFDRFQKLLAAPAQTPRSGMTGEAIFEAVGCGDCHYAPGFVTGVSSEYPLLSGVPIKPYSDCLLHDMGALGDGIVQANASETQFLTRALWGLQARLALLHDGRATGGTFADNVQDAIDGHDGEGAAARAAFNALSPGDQQLVIDFLGSLGRIEFDWERDNDVDEFDYFFVEPFRTNPGPHHTPDDPGALCDIDQDGDFDLRDIGMLQRAYTGNL